jgi:integrase/recombinase XerC
MTEVNSFIQYLKFEKRYSSNTVVAYENDLIDFSDYLAIMEIHEVTQEHVRSWMVNLLERGLAVKSIHRKIAALRSYYKFLNKTGAVNDHPVAGIKLPKLGKRLPEYVQLESMNTLMHRFKHAGTYPEIRDHLIIHLFYMTGIRRSELLGLRRESLDFARQVLKVNGKGGKERLIPVDDQTMELYQKYIVERDGLEDNHVRSFWVTDRGLPVCARWLYATVRKYLKDSGHTGRKGPHILRHTFATYLSNGGADLNAIKELMGHAGLAATQVYTHNSIERLKRVYELAHPKAR